MALVSMAVSSASSCLDTLGLVTAPLGGSGAFKAIEIKVFGNVKGADFIDPNMESRVSVLFPDRTFEVWFWDFDCQSLLSG